MQHKIYFSLHKEIISVDKEILKNLMKYNLMKILNKSEAIFLFIYSML